MSTKTDLNYWHWLFRGSGGKPGIGRLFNWWLVIHLAIGLSMACVVPLTLKDCANAVLLPLVGVIIGLSFAWGGNVQALLQTSEIEDLADHRDGGLPEYVFTYQTAILVLFITLVAFGLAGLDVFDGVWPRNPTSIPYCAIKTGCFFLSSIALRECWHVVLGAQLMLIMRSKIRRARETEKPNPDQHK